MSKRFGRQQKRKLKAQIETLECHRGELGRKVLDLREQLRGAEHVIRIAREVSPNSICFEPQRVDKSVWHYEHHQLELTTMNVTLDGPIDFKIIDLYQLESILRDSDFKDMVHFEAVLHHRGRPEKSSAYRVSKRGFDMVSVDYVANVLARHLK
jgi:hypothetical protein